MIHFILNEQVVGTNTKAGTTLLDFIRYGQDLPGTKIGCREGDCGACTVLEGRLEEGKLRYHSIVSCLTPLGNVQGRHIVTVEGINMDVLSPVQAAMVDHNGTQCGFCTPGFVMSLTGFGMSPQEAIPANAIASVSGNICRCTGYKSIERAAITIARLLKDKEPSDPVGWLVANRFLPEYFRNVPEWLMNLPKQQQGQDDRRYPVMGGGTDLMVQKPEELAEQKLRFFYNREELKGISVEGEHIVIGAASTASDIMESAVLQKIIPGLEGFFRLISSEPIRNMGTIAGNFVNASPIGDLSIMFLALDARLRLTNREGHKGRTVPLEDFFIAYKQLDLQQDEHVYSVEVPLPLPMALFNFEKVSKRTWLDIASVNSALLIDMDGDLIRACRVALGGVAPVPLYLKETSAFLCGKPLAPEVLQQAVALIREEISPISDVRGSSDYKRLLARQLFFAHFLKLFPEVFHVSAILK